MTQCQLICTAVYRKSYTNCRLACSAALQKEFYIFWRPKFLVTVRQRSCWKVIFFSRVCHSVHVGPMYRPPSVKGPVPQLPLCTGPSFTHTGPGPPFSDIWWPRQETCSNLFTWGTPHTHTSADLVACCWITCGRPAGSTPPTRMFSWMKILPVYCAHITGDP